MSTPALAEESKAIVRRAYEEAYSRGDLTAAAQYYTDDYVRHDPATPNLGTGLEAVRQVVTNYRTAFPDLQLTIEDLLAEGEKVVTRWTVRGTHRGDLQGAAPTGKQVVTPGISISRIVEGRIAEEWVHWDTLGLLQQIGAIPG